MYKHKRITKTLLYEKRKLQKVTTIWHHLKIKNKKTHTNKDIIYYSWDYTQKTDTKKWLDGCMPNPRFWLTGDREKELT